MFKLWDIRKNILFMVLAPTVLFCMVLSTYYINDRINTLEKSHLSKGKVIISSLSLIIQSQSLQQTKALQQQLTAFRDSDRDILAVAVISDNGKVISHSGNFTYDQVLVTTPAPVSYQQTFFNKYLKLVNPLTLSGAQEPYYLSVFRSSNTER